MPGPYQPARPIIAATAVLIALAGCSVQPSPTAAEAEPREQATTDPVIQQIIASFPEPLPEGVQWPRTGIDLSDPAANPDQVEQVVGHPGMQDEFIAAYWLCSWMDVYLQAHDEQDLKKRDQAVGNFEKYTSLPAVEKYLSNPQDFDTMITVPARGGASTTVNEYYHSSCSIYRDNQMGGTTG